MSSYQTRPMCATAAVVGPTQYDTGTDWPTANSVPGSSGRPCTSTHRLHRSCSSASKLSGRTLRQCHGRQPVQPGADAQHPSEWVIGAAGSGLRLWELLPQPLGDHRDPRWRVGPVAADELGGGLRALEPNVLD